MRRSILALLAALFAVHGAQAASLADGPYVDGPHVDGERRARWVEGDESAPRVREQKVAVGQAITVPSAGTVPAFEVRIRNPAPVAPDTVSLPNGRPLFVIADIHGEL